MGTAELFADDTSVDEDGVAFAGELLVFHGGGSHKFWAGLRHESAALTWWGPTGGKDGQTKVKPFRNAISAADYIGTTTEKKEAKGYNVVWRGTLRLPSITVLLLGEDARQMIPPGNLVDALIDAAGHDPRR
jgi:predicted DNA-binding WGR domain protein